MHLFFDTETSDLPRNWNAPETDTSNWPRLIQIAWVVTDESGNPVDSQLHLIKPVGFKIAHGAFDRHGISTDFAVANGVELTPVLQSFSAAADRCHSVVAHNIEFDLKIIGAELVRAALTNPLQAKRRRCTMKESTDFCRLPGSRGFKWPTLTELHDKLFHKPFENAHDASADCLACMNCYLRLRELNVM